jgi:hypothetical protein
VKTRAEVDAEIQRENVAITQHNKSVYRWSRVRDRAARDAQIMEWWAMGKEREWIAEHVDLSPMRVSQIVQSFGFGNGWRDDTKESTTE